MIGLFPQNDPNQVIILKRFFLAFASYLMPVGFGVLTATSGDGVIPLSWLPLICLGIFAGNLFFYILIRSGKNKKYSDPSLTAPQIIVSVLWTSVLIFADAENRGLFISVYIMVVMFGIFRLNRTQMSRVALFAFICYGVVMAIDFFILPARFDAQRELLRVGILSGMLIWATLFAGHVSELRTMLRRRNRDLSVALAEIGVLASHDDLTKAYNRRYIMEALNQEKNEPIAPHQHFLSAFLIWIISK